MAIDALLCASSPPSSSSPLPSFPPRSSPSPHRLSSPKFSFLSSISSSLPPPRPSISSSSFLLTLFVSDSALAVNYDDIVTALSPPPPPQQLLPPELGAIFNSLTDFVASNPVALLGGVAVIGFPILLSTVFGQPKTWGVISAKDAFKKLGDEEQVEAQLLDIRSADDVKTEGTPDLRTFKKRVVQLPYGGEDDAYLKKLVKKFKDPSSTTLYILDQFDGNSGALSKFLATNGFKSAFAIKDGAEGPNGWRKNDLPWLLPRKGFVLDVSALRDVFDSTLSENPNLVPATLGVAAAAGVGLVVFSEAETALQLLGSAALIQLFVKKFLFAKDRQTTLKELQTFLDTKIAPKEMVDEIKGIGKVLLPKYDEVSITASINGAATSEISQQVEDKSTVAATTEISQKVEETPTEVTAEKEIIDSSPPTSLLSADLPHSSTPLSPYTQYPDLKPPSLPTSPRA